MSLWKYLAITLAFIGTQWSKKMYLDALQTIHLFYHQLPQSQIIPHDGMCHLQLQSGVSSHRLTTRGFALEPTANLYPFCSTSLHSSSFNYKLQNLEVFIPKSPAADMSDMTYPSRNMLTGGIHVTDLHSYGSVYPKFAVEFSSWLSHPCLQWEFLHN